VEGREHDSVEDRQPVTLGSREESLDLMSHSSVGKNHGELSCVENIHISAQRSDSIFRRQTDSHLTLSIC